jgi:hypothetical protein
MNPSFIFIRHDNNVADSKPPSLRGGFPAICHVARPPPHPATSRHMDLGGLG